MKPLVYLVAVAALVSTASAFEKKTTELWYDDCSRCHAADGSGKCPLGKSLRVKDYSSKEGQSRFSDEEVAKFLLQGKIRDNKKVMPPYKLTSDEVKDMTSFIRSLVKE